MAASQLNATPNHALQLTASLFSTAPRARATFASNQWTKPAAGSLCGKGEG